MIGVKLAAACMAAGATIGAVSVAAAPARADGAGTPCSAQTIPWGLLGGQRRTVCDTARRPDGSWTRERVIWTPAHYTPTTSYCSGGIYFSTCSTSGGQYVALAVTDDQTYPVTDDTVLPDEPGHLGGV